VSVRIFGARDPARTYRVRPAAYAIIFDADRRVACVSEASGLFLPGGGLEPDEDAVQAVHREVAEECARALELLQPLQSAVQFCRTARDEYFELRASFFLGRFGAALAGQAQHALSWLPSEPEVPPLFHECHRWAVQMALGTLFPPPPAPR
jgi:8-oxo-dGTP pyrophosphatase MutT (NUDIX family)